MNFYTYLESTPEVVEQYVADGLLERRHHDVFPLDIYVYGRKATYENVWDNVTSRCRGVIVDRSTGEIVARPFEKFHNYGTPQAGELPTGQPLVIEKLDGFMVTGYKWEGKWYAASKGSFHSPHAKWATVEFQKHEGLKHLIGWTPVFEGLNRDLRIVVDYGDREGLVLLALIHTETGEEMEPRNMEAWAKDIGLESAKIEDFTLEGALAETLRTYTDGLGTEEGFVLLWRRPQGPPFRVKLKYTDYLRLHRLVTGVSPKHIWEVLSQPHLAAELDEFMNNSTPWFAEFTRKWTTALRSEYDRLHAEAKIVFEITEKSIKAEYDAGRLQFHELRKAYAVRFTENKELSSILFSMLDGKDPSQVIWKKVKGMTAQANPLRNLFD